MIPSKGVNLTPRNGAFSALPSDLPLPKGFTLQRLFSMFPNGLPGAGLLLLRLVCGVLTIAGGIRTILAAPHAQTFILSALAFAASLLLLAGLWTPIAGICIVFLEAWAGFSRTSGVEDVVLLATLGAALAALGPGAHSVDARMYGRKRIEIRNS